MTVYEVQYLLKLKIPQVSLSVSCLLLTHFHITFIAEVGKLYS